MLLPIVVLALRSDIQRDPAFVLAKSLVGGTWRGTVGKKMPVQFRFHLEQGGDMIVGEGTVSVSPTQQLVMRSSLGWDATAKKTYYLDQHGTDTVYWGHVSKQGKSLMFEFRGLCGDSGQYLSCCTISGDSYSSTMSFKKNGKWEQVKGFHLALKRKSG